MALLSGIRDRLFYGWVVLAACLVLGTIIFGTRFSFGVFFESIESEFDLSRTATAGVFAIYMVLGSAFAVLGGWALDRYGPRAVAFIMGVFTGSSLLLTGQANSPWQLFLSYSLLLAIGTGASYTVLMSTVSRWFDSKRVLALGIASTGNGLGTMIMAPFAAYLISSFDWRVAFMVMGVISGLIIVSLSLLLKKDPSSIGVLPDGAKPDSAEVAVRDKKDDARSVSFSLRQALRNRNFWYLGAIWLLWSICLHFILNQIVRYAIDLSISAADASKVLGLIGLISIPARLLVGVVSNRIGIKTTTVVCALLQALAVFWLIWSQELWMLYLFAAVFGVGMGGFEPSTVALIGDVVGMRNLGVIMGALSFGWGVGAAIGPVAGGRIYDVNESYFLAFLMAALFMLVAVLFVSLLRREVGRNI